MNNQKVVTVEQKNYVMAAIITGCLQLFCFVGALYGACQIVSATINKQHCGGQEPPGYQWLILATLLPPVGVGAGFVFNLLLFPTLARILGV